MTTDEETGPCPRCGYSSYGLSPPVSLEAHVAWEETFQTDFNKAVKLKLSNRPANPNRICAALLLSWKESGLAEIPGEKRDLRKVLEDGYGFTVEEAEIPSGKKAFQALSKMLENFKDKYDEIGNLMVIYYGGHGHTQNSNCHWDAYVSQVSY